MNDREIIEKAFGHGIRHRGVHHIIFQSGLRVYFTEEGDVLEIRARKGDLFVVYFMNKLRAMVDSKGDWEAI